MPNPDERAHGHAREVGKLARLVAHARLALVVGDDQARTQLVFRAVRRALGAELDRALYHRVSPGGSVDDALVEIVRAISGADADAMRQMLEEPDGLVAAALDHADEALRVVVIDDVDPADQARTEALAAQVTRFARACCWVLASRRAVALPEGAAPPVVLDAPKRRVSTGGDETASRLVRALVAIGAAVPVAVAKLLAPGTSDRAIASLVASGSLRRTAEGVCAGAPGSVEQASPDERAEIGARLAGVDAPALALEGIRLLLESGRDVEATRALDLRGEAIVEAGLAMRLARVVRGATGERMAWWRLRCADELGDHDGLAAVAEPSDRSPATRLLWARALADRGRTRDASDVAVEAIDRARESEPTRARAIVLAARWMLLVGDNERALATLDRLRARAGPFVATRDALAAACLVRAGRRREALERATKARRGLSSLSAAQRLEVGAVLGYVFSAAGEPRLFGDVVATALAGQDATQVIHSRVGRRLLYMRASAHLELGELADARAVLERLEAWAATWGKPDPLVRWCRLQWRIATGELDAIADEIAALAFEQERDQRKDLAPFVTRLSIELAILRGTSPPNETVAGHAASAVSDRILRVDVERANVRRSPGAVAPEPPDDGPEVRVAGWLLRSESLVLAGRADEAIAAAVEGAALATSKGFGVRAAELASARCAALSVARRWAECGQAARALEELASGFPSPRFATEARFFRAASRGTIDWRALFDMIALDDVSPVAARRARALLGGDCPLDAIDRAVLDAIRSRAIDGPAVRVVGPGPASMCLDSAKRRVWIAGRDDVDLSTRPLVWKILEAIVERGGTAAKEHIVTAAWGKSSYHPLRDDNRLHVVIRKLRTEIERDPAHPERLVTTRDGYALAGPVLVAP